MDAAHQEEQGSVSEPGTSKNSEHISLSSLCHRSSLFPTPERWFHRHLSGVDSSAHIDQRQGSAGDEDAKFIGHCSRDAQRVLLPPVLILSPPLELRIPFLEAESILALPSRASFGLALIWF